MKKQTLNTLLLIALNSLQSYCGLLKNSTYMIDELSNDTVAYLDSNATFKVCMNESDGRYQDIQFYAYFKPEDELFGKISFGSVRDSVLTRISDTLILFKDPECAIQIGKIWNNKGIHTRAITKIGETTAIGISGSINIVDLKFKKPWENMFKLAGIQSPIRMNRNIIQKKLSLFGFNASETYSDSEHTIDYYIMGCDPNGIIKAILIYHNDLLIMYWSDEVLKGIPFKLINHKRLYYSNNSVKYIESMKERIYNECIGGIGSPYIEGCNNRRK